MAITVSLSKIWLLQEELTVNAWQIIKYQIDFNRENNCVSNLEWVTNQENTQYSVCNRIFPGQQKKKKQQNR